jgi:hypothetical protein
MLKTLLIGAGAAFGLWWLLTIVYYLAPECQAALSGLYQFVLAPGVALALALRLGWHSELDFLSSAHAVSLFSYIIVGAITAGLVRALRAVHCGNHPPTP